MALQVNYTDAFMRKAPQTFIASPTPSVNAPGGNLPGGAWATNTPRQATATNNNNNNTSSSSNSGARDQWSRYHAGEGDMPAGYSGETNGAGQNIDNLISDMYNPFMQSLDKWGQSLETNKNEDLARTDKDWQNSYQALDARGQSLNNDLADQARQFWESGRTADNANILNYNQIKQQGSARYGQGSSVGQAVSELANQQYLKNAGNLTQQKLQGEQDIGKQKTGVQTFLVDTKNKYDLAKQSVVDQINQQFRAGLNEIAMRKGEAEANKTNAKIALLQKTQELHSQVETADQAARQNLALFAVQQLAKIQGVNFDVGQIPKVYANTMGQIANLSGNGGGVSSGLFSQISSNPFYKKSEDQFA
jgi:hypothetical protein